MDGQQQQPHPQETGSSIALEELPRELVWLVAVQLPVHDLLLGLALTSRTLHRLLAPSPPREEEEEEAGRSREEVEELWRQYALYWRLWPVAGDDDAGGERGGMPLEPDVSWSVFCRQELERWCFTSQLGHTLGPERIIVGTMDELPEEWRAESAIRSQTIREPTRCLVLLDRNRYTAELRIRGGHFCPALVLMQRPIRRTDQPVTVKFRVGNQTGFWMVGMIGAVPSDYDRDRTYHNSVDMIVSYNVDGTFDIPSTAPTQVKDIRATRFKQGDELAIHVRGTVVQFLVNGQQMIPKAEIDVGKLPRPWHFFWGCDGQDSTVTILPNHP